MVATSQTRTKLATARRRAGLSQEDLAARAGVHPHTISKIERGLLVVPRPSTCRKLAAALGCQIVDLFEV